MNIKKGFEDVVATIIKEASFGPVDPQLLPLMGHSLYHISLICEQLAAHGCLTKIDDGRYLSTTPNGKDNSLCA